MANGDAVAAALAALNQRLKTLTEELHDIHLTLDELVGKEETGAGERRQSQRVRRRTR